MTERISHEAARACAIWLSSCLSFGWKHDDLDELQAIWCRYHDERGRLRVDGEEPIPMTEQRRAEIEAAVNRAKVRERERCAKMVEAFAFESRDLETVPAFVLRIAQAIRGDGEQGEAK